MPLYCRRQQRAMLCGLADGSRHVRSIRPSCYDYFIDGSDDDGNGDGDGCTLTCQLHMSVRLSPAVRRVWSDAWYWADWLHDSDSESMIVCMSVQSGDEPKIIKSKGLPKLSAVAMHCAF